MILEKTKYDALYEIYLMTQKKILFRKIFQKEVKNKIILGHS